MDSTICTSLSRPDCPIASTGIAATRRSRTSRTRRASASSTTRRSRCFVDVDNDGDQDLVVATSTNPLLFINDGKGHFTPVPDAFRFARPLQGVLTSITMADYDRDGFLDLYLCVYSYFFGAGEDKAGTPAPHYDARNGPPAVLFRNDGHGRFVDATEDAGLDAGNDRYHFAAAWADYDGDGWPDLLVANDFGTKNLYHNLGRRDGTREVRGCRRRSGRPRSRRRHERRLSRLRQRRPARHLYRQYVERARAARHLGADVHAAMRRRRCARSIAGTSAGIRCCEISATDASRTRRSRRTPRWAAGRGRRTRVDFDSDGWDDLYIVNGMLTRKDGRRRRRRPRGILLAAGRGPLAARRGCPARLTTMRGVRSTSC